MGGASATGERETLITEDNSVPPDGEERTVRLKIEQPGIYRIDVNDGHDLTSVKWPEGQVMSWKMSLEDHPQSMSGRWSLYFYVPKGTKRIGLYSAAGEGSRLLRPDGEKALDLKAASGEFLSAEVPDGMDGKLWRFHHMAGKICLMNVPPFLARSAEELVLPDFKESAFDLRVKQQIERLASKEPPRHQNGFLPKQTLEHGFVSGYISPGVQQASKKLISMGPKIFPILIEYLEDDRFSFSHVSAAWGNYDVGEMVLSILCDREHSHGGYRGRDCLHGKGSIPMFRNYLKEKNAKKWAEWAKSKDRIEIQKDFWDWCVKLELKRGFVSKEQEERIMGNYKNSWSILERRYQQDQN